MLREGIIVVPTQGFANRMRMIASSYALSKQLNLKLYVCWLPSRECNINLSDFISSITSFQTMNFEDIENLKTAYCGRVHTQSIMNDIIKLYEDKSETNDRDYLLIEGGHEFKHPDMSRIKFLYLKKEFYNSIEFSQSIKRKLLNFQYYNELDRTIGIHYRSVNHTYDDDDIKICDRLNFENNSPIKEFENTIAQLKNITQYDHILIVSNSNTFIDNIKPKFRNKHFIQYNVSNFDRNSKEGMEDSIVEWILLGKTRLIIGSYFSSFSDEASFYNIVPKITPLSENLKNNIKDTINNYHCLNYSYIDGIAALNYSDNILINYLGNGLK